MSTFSISCSNCINLIGYHNWPMKLLDVGNGFWENAQESVIKESVIISGVLMNK